MSSRIQTLRVALIAFILMAVSVPLMTVADQPPPSAQLPFSVEVEIDSTEESDWAYIPQFTGVADFDWYFNASCFDNGEYGLAAMEIDTDSYLFEEELYTYQSGIGDDFIDTGSSYGTASLEWLEYSTGADTRRATLEIDCTEREG